MKITNIVALGSVLVGSLLTGCLNLTPPASSVESHGLTLGVKSSPSVQVNGPRLQMNRGILELAGSISKASGASTTAFSHVDILFRDASGNILQTKPVRFAPQSVGHSRFARRTGYYSLTLEPLPEGTTRIEVQAHDGDITAPHGRSRP